MASRSISVHELQREFAKLEAEGKLKNSVDFEKRRWVYYEDNYPTELEMTPSSRCGQHMVRIGNSNHNQLQRKYFSNVFA